MGVTHCGGRRFFSEHLFYFVNDALLISVGETPNNGGWSAEKYSRLGGMEKLE